MSHHYVYQPVTAGGQPQRQQQQQQRPQPPQAPNPWNNPPVAAYPWIYPQPIAPFHVAYPFAYPAMLLAAPAGIHYPSQPNVQFYTSQPAAESMNVNFFPGPRVNGGQGSGNNSNGAQHASGGQASSQQSPIQLVPQVANSHQQLWCRELDGTYTLQTVNKIMQDLQPGYWKKSSSGFPYWVRTAAL